jgi:hypothetical protein
MIFYQYKIKGLKKFGSLYALPIANKNKVNHLLYDIGKLRLSLPLSLPGNPDKLHVSLEVANSSRASPIFLFKWVSPGLFGLRAVNFYCPAFHIVSLSLYSYR